MEMDMTWFPMLFVNVVDFLMLLLIAGSNSVQNISHSLGSVPGMILIKCTSDTLDWSVYHRSLGATKNCHLNNTSVADTQTGVFNDTLVNIYPVHS